MLEAAVSVLTVKLPWPPSINSMYSVGIIGAKRNLEEPFMAVLKDLVENHQFAAAGGVMLEPKISDKELRAKVKAAFGTPRASMFLTDVGKAYRDLAADAIDAQRVPRRALHGRLEVSVMAYPPDARIRDLSNLWKSALDILQHNHVIENDGHFDLETIRRGHQVKGGSFVVTLSEIVEAFESRQQGFDLAAPVTPTSNKFHVEHS